MSQFRRVQVLCPGNAVTGGPEALHHLVHLLRELGVDARLVYTPLDTKFDVPQAYKDFNVEVGRFQDISGDLIIFPEIQPMDALAVKHAKAAIWWLSVDNFLERRHTSKIRDKVRYWKGVLKGRRPRQGVEALKGVIHFSQSYYSSEYLKSNGIPFVDLYEPINSRFLSRDLDTGINGRVDEILFNPGKGKKFTDCLIARFPEIKFTPLKGFTREQLALKFQTAKLYIDFGHHPGRDRMPREAAMHGCCVVTGRMGAAWNPVDIPITDKYKLDSSLPEFETNFGALAKDIFVNFKQHHDHFDAYRDRIMTEPQTFRSQIAGFFVNSN